MARAKSGDAATEGRDLMSVSAAARMLGVSPSSLRAWAAAGRVPHVRTRGGHRRFERETLVQWLRERGAGPPSGPTRTSELVPTRIPPMPAVAGLMKRSRSAIAAVFEEELSRSRALPSRGAAARRNRALESIDALAGGVSSGDLSVFLRDAEWEGFRHGAAGQPGDVPITEALALRRALDRTAIPHLDGRPDERRGVERAMDRMAIRLAAGYADGVKARLRAEGR